MELRKDYVLERWVIIAEKRAERPREFKDTELKETELKETELKETELKETESQEKTQASCFFARAMK